MVDGRSNNSDTIELVFDSIQKGNSHLEESDHWNASHEFSNVVRGLESILLLSSKDNNSQEAKCDGGGKGAAEENSSVPLAEECDKKKNRSDDNKEGDMVSDEKNKYKLQEEEDDDEDQHLSQQHDGSKAQNAANAEEENENEKDKIIRLYEIQSKEYLHRARVSLIKAMSHEEHEIDSGKQNRDHGKDQQRQHDDHDEGTRRATADTHCQSLTDEESMKRLHTFRRLFTKFIIDDDERLALPTRKQSTKATATPTKDSGETSLKKEDGGDDDDDNDDKKAKEEQISSLEDRLRTLNKNLPKGFKTTTERMIEINRGLNRLGLSSIVTSTTSSIHNPHKDLLLDDIKDNHQSEDDQINDIIAQARDEVAMAGKLHQNGHGHNDNNNKQHLINQDDDEGFDDDVFLLDNNDDDDDAEDSNDIKLSKKKLKQIQSDMIDAQTKLTELISMIQFSLEEKEEGKDDGVVSLAATTTVAGSAASRKDGGDGDDDDDAFCMDHAQALHLLKQTRKLLFHTKTTWTGSGSSGSGVGQKTSK